MTALVSVIGFSASAQKLEAAKVPDEVKKAFVKKFPQAIPKWEKESGKFEANFKQNGNAMSALFQPNGTMTESETDIKVSDLPVSVLNYVKEHYKGKTIKAGAKITKTDGTINYEAEIGGKDVIFNDKGVFLHVAKD